MSLIPSLGVFLLTTEYTFKPLRLQDVQLKITVFLFCFDSCPISFIGEHQHQNRCMKVMGRAPWPLLSPDFITADAFWRIMFY